MRFLRRRAKGGFGRRSKARPPLTTSSSAPRSWTTQAARSSDPSRLVETSPIVTCGGPDVSLLRMRITHPRAPRAKWKRALRRTTQVPDATDDVAHFADREAEAGEAHPQNSGTQRCSTPAIWGNESPPVRCPSCRLERADQGVLPSAVVEQRIGVELESERPGHPVEPRSGLGGLHRARWMVDIRAQRSPPAPPRRGSRREPPETAAGDERARLGGRTDRRHCARHALTHIASRGTASGDRQLSRRTLPQCESGPSSIRREAEEGSGIEPSSSRDQRSHKRSGPGSLRFRRRSVWPAGRGRRPVGAL